MTNHKFLRRARELTAALLDAHDAPAQDAALASLIGGLSHEDQAEVVGRSFGHMLRVLEAIRAHSESGAVVIDQYRQGITFALTQIDVEGEASDVD